MYDRPLQFQKAPESIESTHPGMVIDVSFKQSRKHIYPKDFTGNPPSISGTTMSPVVPVLITEMWAVHESTRSKVAEDPFVW